MEIAKAKLFIDIIRFFDKLIIISSILKGSDDNWRGVEEVKIGNGCEKLRRNGVDGWIIKSNENITKHAKIFTDVIPIEWDPL
jgi:hypothetical protein